MAKEEIKQLLTKLEKETVRGNKQKIRAKLRSLGHKGGLRKVKKKTTKKKKVVKKSTKK